MGGKKQIKQVTRICSDVFLLVADVFAVVSVT